MSFYDGGEQVFDELRPDVPAGKLGHIAEFVRRPQLLRWRPSYMVPTVRPVLESIRPPPTSPLPLPGNVSAIAVPTS